MRSLFPTLLAFATISLASASAGEPEKGAAALSLLKTLNEGFVELFEKVAPAVVVIEAIKHPDEEENDAIKGFDLLFDDAREGSRQKDGDPHAWRPPTPPARSEGSGFIIRSDGFILTNNHVAAGAEELQVRLRDGRTFVAKLVGADEKTDIAVLRIEAKNLPVAEFGDSDKLRVGELVCAIGTPFSQDFSFTAGYVSGKNRSNLLGPTSPTILYEDYIQTDAFINPGNSGGPLFDVEGRVVGMNTLIHGIGRGLAFAIPSSMLRDVSGQLIATGNVRRSWLGIRIESLNENAALRERFQGIEKGVVVDTIEAGAPAIKSDLRPADVIMEVDGVQVATAQALQKEILKKKVGQLVQLSVWRGGGVMKISVETAELPGQIAKAPDASPKPAAGAGFESLGMKLRDSSAGNVVVSGVALDSPAARAGIFPDDIISDVETNPVENAASCAKAIAAAGGLKGEQGVILNIERNGKRTFVVLHQKR